MSISDEEFKKRLGKKIESLRVAKNLGVREFALIADIEHHQLINIEKGRVDIRLKTLRKIAEGFSLSSKDLLDFE